MPYVLVACAIVSEVTATLSLRGSHGFTRPLPSVVVAVGYVAAFVLLALALKSLDVGPVYAIWSGLGTVGALAGGAVIYGERITPTTALGAALIIIGVAVLYLGGGNAHG
ncbi:small multidrug resistance pump [Actinacidiphila yanglinensis]|uniref:Small multidrug resistance pump n=1 Tax=Actinacidiphila yanglinensis TaxID=310779 RepID=A0A1H6DP44_9ACTN|nr:multidrug efflux SMR transporter [Actinacidiphila yanglinensis]SEG86416.1 small multidrug resistance pump [Actinacidiphila yanglinensis]